jgi:hypothetical protein
MIQLRTYHPDDWDAIAVIHDRARLDELRSSVGVDAFLSLAATFENEGLFEGEVWVACEGETVEMNRSQQPGICLSWTSDR